MRFSPDIFRRGAGLLATGAALMLIAGCGVSPDEAPDSAGASGSAAKFQEPRTGKSRTKAKPTPRQEGVIRIAGKAQGSLTERLVRKFNEGGSAIDIKLTGGNEQTAFRDFCKGQIDVVDSARPISEAEYRKCVEQGIQPVQFQVASDAAILAIKNETNVGVDCLSFGEVHNIFRAGSGINSWAQVGYGHTMSTDSSAPRMKVAGPDENSNVFGFFGQYVLGDNEPSLLSVRTDYEAYPSDAGVRRAVVGSNHDFYAAEQFDRSRKVYDDVVASLAENRQAVRDARAEVKKGIKDQRSEAAQARDRRLLAEAKSKLRDLTRSIPESKRYIARNRAAVRRIEQVRGSLGLFRFSYYEAFEEQLRPMEISTSSDFNKPECIFPSQATVTNATYPLSRQLLLTVNYRNMMDPDLNEFLSESLNRSQALAEEAALVPLPDEVRDTEKTWLDGSSEPDVIFYQTGTSVTEGSGDQNAGSTDQDSGAAAGGSTTGE